MNLKNFKITSRGLYWGLILAFGLLYLCVGFVSTLHSITFFHLANSMGLAVLLGLTYEIGQSAVLFSILMTKNKEQFLPWLLMILLTALQVTANVFASFKWMVQSGSNDWIYWQKAILIGVTAANPEMYQIIISWIAGALLPVVALGMTALVANNMKHMNELIGEIPDYSNPPNSLANDYIETEKNEDTIPVKEDIVEKTENLTQKAKRFVNPLKKKSHIDRLRNISEINKPSKGDEVIEYLMNEEKNRVKESINSETLNELVSPETSPEPSTVLPNESPTPVEVQNVEAVEIPFTDWNKDKISKRGK